MDREEVEDHNKEDREKVKIAFYAFLTGIIISASIFGAVALLALIF